MRIAKNAKRESVLSAKLNTICKMEPVKNVILGAKHVLKVINAIHACQAYSKKTANV